MIGKTNEAYLKEGIAIFEKRIKRYIPFESVIWPDIKNAGKMDVAMLKQKEGQMILSKLEPKHYLILLDEQGKVFSSVAFAKYFEGLQQRSYKRVVFLVGGAFGFSDEIYQRANQKISLSDMTFSHQMVRLFFTEQLYRALSILHNEPYHNA